MPESPPSPPPATPAPAAPPQRLAGAALWLSLATLVSRVLGLVREQVFAALLGAGFFGDAFTMAFRLPNLLRDLFAEGALSAAFQPAFQAARKQEGAAAAQRLANLVGTCLLFVVGLLTLLGVLFAPQMVAHWAQGFALIPGKTELTVLLTRIMMPFLLLVSLAALAMGMLNAQERFTPPALAPALFNLATVVTGLALWGLGIGRSQGAAVAWALATLLGGGLQLGLQLVPLHREGYRPRLAFDLRHPGLRTVVRSMAPATIGLMATQVNIYVSSQFASSEQGAVSWLYYAFRLIQLPIGMFGVAVGTIALQRAADAASESDLSVAIEGIRTTLRRGLRLVTFYSLPMMVLFYVLAVPILGIVYQRGEFRAEDTLATASALRYYALGLVFYSAVKVIVPIFYALRAARVAVLATVLTVLCSVAFNVLLHPRFGYRALALSTSVGAAVNFGVLFAVFMSRYGGLLQAQVVLAVLRMAAAATVMGLVLHALSPLCLGAAASAEGFMAGPSHVPLWRAILGLGVLGGAGGLSYALLCALMQVEEVGEVLATLRRRLPGARRA
ncbi:MAG TPA: murein biosynthesis integral membrane protein MurJ [Pseudomonadota bacterium]|nr:murein biosynthesis integral membrane protein MurJ [Pseudomonadota bacterium]